MKFLEKYELLKKSVPVPALYQGLFTENCEFVDYTYQSKNCYYCFDAVRLADSMYTVIGWGNSLVDCLSVTESEKCYQCIDSNKCHNSTYLLDCNNCTDCHFSAFLNSCTDCFGCVGLAHKKYCIFNKQCTKEEYVKELKKLKKEDPNKVFSQMLALKRTIPHPASQQFNNENCSYGDYIYNSKNCYWSFNSYYSENSGYSYTSGVMKNSWDMFFSGGTIIGKFVPCEKCYECIDTDICYNCAFMKGCSGCTNCYYSTDLRNCTDCFGCVGLTKKKYCILNNQLTKEKYNEALAYIKKELGWKV